MNKRYFIIFASILLTICGLWSETTLQEQFQNVQNYKKDLFRQTQQFIIDHPDSPNLPKLHYNLAELSTSIYRDDPSVTLDLYKKVLELDPNFYDKEVILYNIAYYSYKIAKDRIDDNRPKFAERYPSFTTWPDTLKFSDDVFAEAKDFYSKVLKEFSYTDYYDESIFKLALLFSDIANDADIPVNYYKKSAAFLSILINRDSVNPELKTDALFQRAWAYYSMSDWDKAIVDYSEILKDNSDYTKLYYHDFSIENVAYTMVGIDSTDYYNYAKSSDYFIENYYKLFTAELDQRIIDKIIMLKMELNAPMQAGDYYMARINLDPLNIKNPAYVDSILSLYNNFASQIRDGKKYRDVVKERAQYSIDNYGFNTEWYLANKDKPEFMTYFNSIRSKFRKLEEYYNNDLLNDTSIENYQRYINLINSYAAIPEFKDDEGIAWLNDKSDKMINFGFQLAESTGQTEYYLFTYNLILNQEKITADTTIVYRKENMLFSAAQFTYFNLKDTVKDSLYYDKMNNIEITPTLLDSLYITGASRFYKVITSKEFYTKEQDEFIKSILWNRSIINSELGKDDLVIADLNELLNYKNDRLRTRDIYVLLAQLHEKKFDYASSENFYAKAEEFANDQADKDELHQSYLAQIDRSVNKLAESQDFIAAAQEQLRLASKFEEEGDQKTVYDLRDKAREYFFRGGDYQRTITLLLENAELKTEKTDIHALYYNAWSIADTLMHDSLQVVTIQNKFIDKFPKSIEAYSIILNQIVDEASSPATKYIAAHRYLALHDRAKAGQIDIGENKTEDIYKSAINIYLEDEVANKDTLISLMTDFEKMYPDDKNSMDYLKYIAKIYLDTDKDKYEEIAHYIYQKDPTVDLYSQIAYQKIDDVVKQADSAFKAENWDLMNEKMAEVRKLQKYYTEKNVKLDMAQVDEWFEYYTVEYNAWKEYQEYLKKRREFFASYDKRLKNIRDSWVNADDSSIFRVNPNTKFKTHILDIQNKTVTKEKNRIQYIFQLANQKEQELVKLLQDAAEWNLDTERKVALFYTAGEIWDHAASVAQKRLNFYYTQSNEVYDWKKALGKDATVNLIEYQLKPATDSFINRYKEEAKNRYLNVYNIFVDGTGYTDSNIKKMIPKIADLIPSLKIDDNIPSSAWTFENNLLVSPDTLITPRKKVVEISEFTTNRNLRMGGYVLSPYNSVYLTGQFNAEIAPAKGYLQFAYPDTASIKFWINDRQIKGLSAYVDSLNIDGRSVEHRLLRLDYTFMKAGVNTFSIRADNVSDTTAVLALNLQIAFDNQQLEYFLTTAEDQLTTDSQWKMTSSYTPGDSVMVAWEDVESYEDLYPTDKIYDMESTKAEWIYAISDIQPTLPVEPVIEETAPAVIDSTVVVADTTLVVADSLTVVDSISIDPVAPVENNSYVKFFKKEFVGYSEVLRAALKFAAVEKATIWLNDVLISEELEAFLDEENNAIFSNPVDIDPTLFRPELNTLVIKVESTKEKAGLILELNIVYKKGGE
jgi:hypothetical protein